MKNNMCCISIIVLSLLLTLSPISPYAFAAPSLTGAPISYEVTCMDTLPEIATHYGVDWTQLARLNSIRGLLQEGMVLEIPSPRTNTLYNQCDAVKHVEMQTSGNLMGHAPNCELKFFEINMNTGNFHLACNDATIQEYYGAFPIRRIYNSKMSAFKSPFGRGWSFQYGETLTRCQDGGIAYHTADGSVIYFYSDRESGYHYSPTNPYLTLSVIRRNNRDATESQTQIVEYQITDSDGTVYYFNEWGLLDSVADPNGWTVQVFYDAFFSQISIVTPGKHMFVLEKNARGLISDVKLPNGHILRYDYDKDDNLVCFTDETGIKTYYEYDDNHQLTGWSDANKIQILENKYDEYGRVIKQLDGERNAVLVNYDDGETTAIDALGNTTVYYYDEKFRTKQIGYPDGTYKKFGYTEKGDLAWEENALKHRTSYEYDALGNITTQTRFDGASRVYEYTPSGNLAMFKDWDDITTRYEYDEKNDCVKTIFQDGTVTSEVYDSEHKTVRTEDAAGNIYTYKYKDGQQIQMRRGWFAISYKYDKMGNLLSTTNPDGSTSLTQYDAAGRITALKDTENNWIRYQFDDVGRLAVYTDDKAGKTTYTYDNNDNILSMSSENYGTCYLTYDAAGSQDSLIDEHGMKTIIERDSMYRITAQINPDGSRTEFGYDKLGNLLSVNTPDGNTVTYTYDYRTNQISGVTDSQGNVQETEYDIAGRPLRQTYRDGTFVELEYNDMGRVISFTDTNGKKTIYSYNAAGYELGSWWTSKNPSAPYIYDANGQRIIVNKDGTIDSPDEYATVTTGKRPGM